MSFLELTTFDGDKSLNFHIEVETGEIIDCYALKRFVGDESYLFKSKHFDKKDLNGMFVHAKREFIPYLWRQNKKYLTEEDLLSSVFLRIQVELTNATKKYTDESKWTKHNSAKTKNDEYCFVTSESAFKFCLLGGIAKCYPEQYEKVKIKILEELNIGNIVAWNDANDRTFQDIKNLVEKLDI
jgi:hypothetical protein